MLLVDLQRFCSGVLLPGSCETQMEGERRKSNARQEQMQRTQSRSVPLQMLQKGWLRASWAVADHTRNALILSVFGFKVSSVAMLASNPITF